MTSITKNRLRNLFFNEICECENEIDKLNEQMSVVKNQQTEYVRQKAIDQIRNYISFLTKLITDLDDAVDEDELIEGTDEYELQVEGNIPEND